MPCFGLVLQQEGGKKKGGCGEGQDNRTGEGEGGGGKNPLAACAGQFQECVLGHQCQSRDPGEAARPGEGAARLGGKSSPPPAAASADSRRLQLAGAFPGDGCC